MHREYKTCRAKSNKKIKKFKSLVTVLNCMKNYKNSKKIVTRTKNNNNCRTKLLRSAKKFSI